MGSIGGMINSSGAGGVANPHCTNTMPRKFYPPATSAVAAAAADFVIARDAAEAAESSRVEAAAELLLAMQTAELTACQCDSGKISVIAGRRTVSIVDPALTAEINLLKERGVRTGRAVANIGKDYTRLST